METDDDSVAKAAAKGDRHAFGVLRTRHYEPHPWHLCKVTPPGSPALRNDALRCDKTPDANGSAELGFLRRRHKDPGQTVSKLIETPILSGAEAGADARFAAAIAGRPRCGYGQAANSEQDITFGRQWPPVN